MLADSRINHNIQNTFINPLNLFLHRGTTVQDKFHTKKRGTNHLIDSSFIQIRCWQRVIFPGSSPPCIFTAKNLYDRVADFA